MGKKRKTNKNLPERVYFKHGSYYFVTYQNKWIRLDSKFAVALAKYAKLLQEPKKVTTMKDLIERYLFEVAPKKAQPTYRDYIRRSKSLIEVFADMNPLEVETTHVSRYLDMKGNVSANRDIALLSSVFKKAIRWGYVKVNPCRGVERNEEMERDRYITDNEFIQRKKVMPEWITLVMDIAYLTSLRKTDILKIKLKEDLTDAILKVTQSKTGKKQAFLLVDDDGKLNDLGMVIQKAKRTNKLIKSFYLFCNRYGKPYTTGGFDSIWQRHAKKDDVQDFQFRDLRSKAITDAEAQGINPKKLSGHKTDAMVNRYIKRYKVEKIKPLKKVL
tara:strand:+ start:4833 stop:5822 length:990 start_codon:yes stop_codon:yes gene_type:complete